MMRLFLKRYLFFLLVLFLTACGGGGGGGGGGTVVLPTPSPRGITAVPENGKVTITWIVVAGTTYNLYMDSVPGVTKEKNTMTHKGITSPFPHTELTNGTLYFFVLTAVGPAGESKGSVEVSVTPSASVAVPTAITAGDNHTCATLADKKIKCWGANGSSQVGNGNPLPFSAPVVVFENLMATTTPNAVTAGGSHACAILPDNTVKCWGANELGQMGTTPNTNTTNTPTFVSGLGTTTAITAGGAHTCAILLDSTVKCWGKNEYGQLGDKVLLLDDDGDPLDPPPSPSFTPVSVSGITSVKAIVAGDDHTCAILSDNDTVKCWGKNESGQLGNVIGDGTIKATSTPMSVSGDLRAKSIAAGGTHTCARLFDNTVKCWGSNGFGQLGNSSIANDASTPVLVAEIATTTAIAAGANHTCVILLDTTVKCWGANDFGQLGNNAFNNLSTSSPVKVVGVAGAVAIEAGGLHTCAVLTSGIVVCWGDNTKYQLGADNNKVDKSSVLVQVEGIP